jgi:hypothetical protein
MAEEAVAFGHVPGHMALSALRPPMQEPREQPCTAVELSATKFVSIFIFYFFYLQFVSKLLSLLGKALN